MLPLKTILIHRLNSVAKVIDDLIYDHVNGLEIDDDDEDWLSKTSEFPSNIYYSEVTLSFYFQAHYSSL